MIHELTFVEIVLVHSRKRADSGQVENNHELTCAVQNIVLLIKVLFSCSISKHKC